MSTTIVPPTPQTAKIVTITPELAAEWLLRNTRNRPLRANHVDYLAAEISNGRWKLDGATIKVNDGALIDGQHRLSAIVKSGRSVCSWVIFGVSADVFDTVDTGVVPRSTADIMSLAGMKNAPGIAAATQFVYRYFTDSVGSGKKLSAAQMLEKAREYAGIEKSVLFASNRPCGTPTSILAGCHYLFTQIDKDLADKFVEDLYRGNGLLEDDPVWLLRERLRKNGLSKLKMRPVDHAALIIKAWNLRRAGEKVTLLAWRTGGQSPERFPEVK